MEARRAAAGVAPRPVAATSPRVASGASASLVREGEYWSLGLAGQGVPGGVVRLKDSDGLRYLDHLVGRPGVEVHVLDLVPLARGAAPRDGAVPDRGDAGPLLDAAARAAYRRRLADLRATLDEATANHDRGRADRARAEIEFLEDELSRAVGLSGRDRPAASAAERARVTVTLRIRDALKRIEDASPALAAHLRRRIRTGVFCCYRAGEDPT
jgi:hypothetical protein